MIEIREIKEEKVWESFVSLFEKRTFLCSWSWGEFRSLMGDKIYRRGVWLDQELKAVFFAYKVKTRKGSFMLMPHNPLIKEKNKEILLSIINEVEKIGRKEKCCFIRTAPLWQDNSDEDKIIKEQGFINSLCQIFPEKSWELSLDCPESEILSGARKSVRYEIRKNSQVEIVQSQDLKSFYEIYKETAKRNKFVPFSFEYLENEFKTLSQRNEISLFLAKESGKYLAGAIIVFWQGIAFYHHGASIQNRNSFSLPALIQWQCFKEAQKRNCFKYNFWVIAPNDDPNHRWAGLTFFKKGFGGYQTEYSKTKDKPLSWRYWLFRFYEKISEK